MRMNRRSLRRLIESVINESALMMPRLDQLEGEELRKACERAGCPEGKDAVGFKYDNRYDRKEMQLDKQVVFGTAPGMRTDTLEELFKNEIAEALDCEVSECVFQQVYLGPKISAFVGWKK